MLALNEDKSRVAAVKILQAHRHLDMNSLFDSELDLLVAPRGCLAQLFCNIPPRPQAAINFRVCESDPYESKQSADGVVHKKKGRKYFEGKLR